MDQLFQLDIDMTQLPGKPLALISVTDKTGIVDFARSLEQLGFQILSTGGTAKLLAESGIAVQEAGAHTGSPEILDGRVKTLHPKIHGGILYDRSKDAHVAQCREHSIQAIDLVVVNLYQFAAKAVGQQLDLPQAIEYIDIGGPTMLRAAAKNYRFVAPLLDPNDYERCLTELKSGGLTDEFRRYLAAKTFRAISQYDSMIASYYEKSLETASTETLAPTYDLHLESQQSLRYGENPHQKARFYRSSLSTSGGLQDAKVLQGKELSYNNLLDCDAAVQMVADFPEYTAVTIIKHNNPCGAALGRPGERLLDVYQRALAVDPKSAFGGIVAVNKTIDAETADALSQLFLECIVAPAFSPEARTVLASKKNLRLLELPYLLPDNSAKAPKQLDVRSVLGGILVQDRDQVRAEKGRWEAVTHLKPTDAQAEDLTFAMRLCKHVKSNAIVYVKDLVTVAVGAGQMSRIDSATFAAEKAKEFGRTVQGSVMASDAFFPFRDTVDLAAKLGVSAIIQPGGSMRDEESIQAANEHKIAMVFTGVRHFKH
jgi:phosphoribosylaminoimidazolecarboxamide formyltransferase/IMP cyclohydrolase